MLVSKLYTTKTPKILPKGQIITPDFCNTWFFYYLVHNPEIQPVGYLYDKHIDVPKYILYNNSTTIMSCAYNTVQELECKPEYIKLLLETYNFKPITWPNVNYEPVWNYITHQKCKELDLINEKITNDLERL